MAMDASTMADLITANIKAVNPSTVEAEIKAYWEPICQGIIDHLTSDAEVLPGSLKDSLTQPITGVGELS